MISVRPEQFVSRETMDKLTCYHALLLKWQKSINLVSQNSLEQAWPRHFLDSLQILDLLPAGERCLFDLGSGAGFPGLVLACARSDLDVHLIESDQRKCSFMRSVSRETKTPVHIHNTRIESFEAPFVPDVITVRALASLSDLCAYIMPWAAQNPDLLLLLPKGQNHAEEIAGARAAGYEFSLEAHRSLYNENSVILALSDLCKKSA